MKSIITLFGVLLFTASTLHAAPSVKLTAGPQARRIKIAQAPKPTKPPAITITTVKPAENKPQTPSPVVPAVSQAPMKSRPAFVPILSGNDAKMFIYTKESGNIPCKINGGAVDCTYAGPKACGIGQALPCAKLLKECRLDNYACQDAWFTRYMQQRYGSWEAARAFWLCIGRCTNKYGTITKNSTWW